MRNRRTFENLGGIALFSTHKLLKLFRKILIKIISLVNFGPEPFRSLVQRKHSIARFFHSAIQRYSSALFQCYFSSKPPASTFPVLKKHERKTTHARMLDTRFKSFSSPWKSFETCFSRLQHCLNSPAGQSPWGTIWPLRCGHPCLVRNCRQSDA